MSTTEAPIVDQAVEALNAFADGDALHGIVVHQLLPHWKHFAQLSEDQVDAVRHRYPVTDFYVADLSAEDMAELAEECAGAPPSSWANSAH